MNIVCPKKSLVQVLEGAVGISDKKSAVTGLSMVLLRATCPDILFVLATDMYRSLTGSCEAEVIAPGEATIPAKDLFDRVRSMPDGPVEIVFVEGRSTVSSVGAKRRFQMMGIPPEEYPAIPRPTDGQVEQIEVGDLADLLSRTKHSISTDETKPHVNSACVELAPDEVRVIATDGHRLAIARLTRTEERPGNTTRLLIPSRAVNDIMRLCESAPATTKCGLIAEGNNLFLEVDRRRFAVRLVEATFPRYEQILSPKPGRQFSAPRQDLIDLVNAMSVASKGDSGGVRLTLQRGQLLCTAESAETGSGHDEIPVDYKGPEVSMGVSGKYLIDALGGMAPPSPGVDDVVTIYVEGELTPLVIEPGWQDPRLSTTAVVMPMRI